MKLPLLAAAALMATMSVASAQWSGPPGYPAPPPPPGYGPPPGWRPPPPPPGYGYRRPPPRRCWIEETPWGARRVCRTPRHYDRRW